MGQKTYFSLSFPIFLYFSFGALAQSTLGMKGENLHRVSPVNCQLSTVNLLTSKSTAFWWRPVVAIVIATTVVVIAASATLGVSGLSATFA